MTEHVKIKNRVRLFVEYLDRIIMIHEGTNLLDGSGEEKDLLSNVSTLQGRRVSPHM